MADLSQVAMEPHHVIRDTISASEANSTGPTYEDNGVDYSAAPALPLPQGGE